MICLHKNNASDTGFFLAPHAGGYPEQFFFLVKQYLHKFSFYSTRYPRDDIKKYENFDRFVDILAEHIASTNIKQWFFFGISLGGYLTYLLVHLLQKSQVCNVESLILASVNDPLSLIKKLRIDPSKDQMINKILSSSIIQKSLIDEMNIKDNIKSDLSFYQTSTRLKSGKINLPITILFGTKDTSIDMEESVRFWKEKTSKKIEVNFYAGGHIPISEAEKTSLLDVMDDQYRSLR
jgi:surfactin synthase thioesterase subunit